jgi:hypothetical protein
MDISKIASRVAEGWQDHLHGGLADDDIPENFNPMQLINGLIVELEHVNGEAHEILKKSPEDVHKALEIAMDHLTEDAEYYSKLTKMEGERFIK